MFNCSDGVDYKMTGTMFSGLSQTGAWACLDEFNRIEVEVLSVVASQISAVMQAIKAGLDRYVFMGITFEFDLLSYMLSPPDISRKTMSKDFFLVLRLQF